MKIGFYDHNSPSGLTPAIISLREEGIVFVNYEEIPKPEDKIPQKFIANPTLEENYLPDMRNCIKSHTKTSFALIIPALDGGERMREAKGALEGLSNVVYIGPNEAEKLFKFLKGQ